jgi:hypothetical protein
MVRPLIYIASILYAWGSSTRKQVEKNICEGRPDLTKQQARRLAGTLTPVAMGYQLVEPLVRKKEPKPKHSAGAVLGSVALVSLLLVLFFAAWLSSNLPSHSQPRSNFGIPARP